MVARQPQWRMKVTSLRGSVHPEVEHTRKERIIKTSFIRYVTAGKLDYEEFHRENPGYPQKAGDNKVLCALSGSVDSSVAAVLVHKAVGCNLTCIFVDHGLLRKMKAIGLNIFKNKFKINFIKVDAGELLSRLKGIES